MDSSRYPGKTLEPIQEIPLIGWALESAQKIKGIDGVILASPDTEKDRQLERFAEKLGAQFFPGSEDDVLGRFVHAAERFGADHIVRICGDNPLLDHAFMGHMVETHIQKNTDYTRTFSPIPLGTVGEVVRFTALKRSAEKTQESRYRIHVTTYILDHPDDFRIHSVDAPDYLKGLLYRLTIDTEQDMVFFRELAKRLKDRGMAFDLANALSILKENPDLAQWNSSVPQNDWRTD